MVGKTLGHYKILEPLGAGGMGEVYRARDTKLDRDVAIKVLPKDFATDQDRLARFEREAKLLASLNHANIATIHGLEDSDGVRFIAMELVEGETLAAQIARSGRIEVDEAMDIARQIAEALEAAHENGVIHRDLKPANVIVTPDGKVKVLDFGLAKTVEAASHEADMSHSPTVTVAGTQAGVILGTAPYMSPEQVRGQPVDKRADIWAFGCVLYEMLAGKGAFHRDTVADTLAAILEVEPDWRVVPEDLPFTVRHLLGRCLQKDPARRLRDIGDARIELEDAIRQPEGLLLAPVIEPPDRTHTASWNRWMVVAVVVAAIFWGSWTQFGSWGSSSSDLALPPRVTQTQLTNLQGAEFGGTISPDGEWFAYARQAGDDANIFLQSVGTRSPIAIAHDGVSPVFSPDGSQIAFSAPPTTGVPTEGGGISIMGRTGDDVRRLTDFGFNPAWSPDGKKIVFGEEFVTSNPYTRTAIGLDLHVVEVASGIVSPLPVPDGVQPTWSPHGDRIAYWSIVAGQRDIFSVPAAGGDPVPVTSDDAVDFSPAWSPDGNWLYWVSNRGGAMAIWRVAIDEVSGDVLGDPQRMTTGGPSEPGMLSISSDGTRLIYTETLTRSVIRVADFDMDALSISPDMTSVVEGSRRLLSPDVSPDGEWLVYRSERAPQDLFIARTDGTEERQITNDLAGDWSPRWSPDGQRITFYSNFSGNYEIWVVNPDGSGRVRLTDSSTLAAFPIWSADGTRIMYTDFQDSLIIDANLPFDRQEPVRLPRVPETDHKLTARDWSKDGDTVLGSCGPAGSNVVSEGICVYHIDSDAYEMIAPGTGINPLWLGDGRRVLYQVPGSGYFVVDTETREIWPVAASLPTIHDLTLAPDSHRVYLLHVDTESDIWLLEIQQR